MNFPRGDVKDKHLKRHHLPDDTGADIDGHLPKKLTSARQERSKQACDQCRSRKLKCDNTHPCGSCRSKKLPCEVSSDRKGPGRPRADIVVSPQIPGPQDVSHRGTASASLDGEAPALQATSVPSNLPLETSDALPNKGPCPGPTIEMPSISANSIQHSQNAIQFHEADTALSVSNMDFFTDGDFVGQSWGDCSLSDGLWQLPMVCHQPDSYAAC